MALRLSLAAAGLFWAVCFVGMFQARAQVAVSTVWGCLVFALFFFGTWLHHARLRIAVGDDCVWFRGLRRDVRVGFGEILRVNVVPSLMLRLYLVVTRRGVLCFSSHVKGHRELFAILIEKAQLGTGA